MQSQRKNLVSNQLIRLRQANVSSVRVTLETGSLSSERRCLYPFRKRSMPLLTVDAILSSKIEPKEVEIVATKSDKVTALRLRN